MTRQILWSASLILLLHSKLIQRTAYRATNISNTVLHDKDHLISSLNDTKTSVGGEFCNGEGFVPNLIRKSVNDFESQLQTIDQMVDDDATKIIDGSSELIAATNHMSEEMRKVIIHHNCFHPIRGGGTFVHLHSRICHLVKHCLRHINSHVNHHWRVGSRYACGDMFFSNGRN
mgnify:CR=1 FL=1